MLEVRNLAIRPTRATFPGEEGGDAFVAQVCGPDLVRSAGHDLFSCQASTLDEPANRVVAHTKQLGGFGHRRNGRETSQLGGVGSSF